MREEIRSINKEPRLKNIVIRYIIMHQMKNKIFVDQLPWIMVHKLIYIQQALC